jgi:hypothetical protein
MKKSNQFHELLQHEEALPLPSERSFSYVMAGVFFFFAALGWWHSRVIDVHQIRLIFIGGVFLAVGYTKPLWLRPLNKIWMQLGHILFKITNPIIMLVIYVVTIVPMGFVLRMMGKDPLRRSFDNEAKTYWVTRDIPGPPPDTMKRQF